MSNLGIAGFKEFKESGKTREDLEDYFEDVFYHKPNKEQIIMFHEFLIGKEQDFEKMIEFCKDKIQEESTKQL